MVKKQQPMGHSEMPITLADLLLGFCLRQPDDTILDPGCGEGKFLQRVEQWLQWLAAVPADIADDPLWGVEQDQELVRKCYDRLPNAHVINQNYFAQEPETWPQFDLVAGNLPYAPTQSIGRLTKRRARQLPLFPDEDQSLPDSEKLRLVSQKLADSLGGRAGLHAYYFLHSEPFLKEGGRLGFVVPNGWLDVAYGVELKQYLLDHFQILAIVESSVERWFPQSSVNTCLVILAKCGVWRRRQGNLVRLVRLRQPLRDLFPGNAASPQRFVSVEQMVSKLMSGYSHESGAYGVHVMEQGSLRAAGKWGKALRAPAVYRRHRDHLDLHTLKRWAVVQRGYTTGANEFFYLDAAAIEQWSIEEEFRRPLLKSMRGIENLRVKASDCRHELLFIRPNSDLRGTATQAYIKWGEDQGFHLRQTFRSRQPWYILPAQSPAPIVMAKGVWQRHMSPILEDNITVDQQLYQILPVEHVPVIAAAALLNSSWFALQIELHGRVSLGRGLLWLATYELGQVRLPDPRRLKEDQIEQLEKTFLGLVERPFKNGGYDLDQPERREMDAVVFDVLNFSDSERTAVLDSLKERLHSRKQQAAYGGE
ncbi:MAG: N-6 DNA methylase [Candidatus Promineifilaceae bacterium]|nr:N-6 DNA methylase [Candidatus Promineifilaceae bacterium]